mmetsp:Transcript_56548/g.132651  ORF Transcript_56548/g.132651 Transcript_56548/m.132651 type:complete len:220 (-) Transcript_56548:101-760(-)
MAGVRTPGAGRQRCLLLLLAPLLCLWGRWQAGECWLRNSPSESSPLAARHARVAAPLLGSMLLAPQGADAIQSMAMDAPVILWKTDPPTPSKNPLIRKIQAEAWKTEPQKRQRLWLIGFFRGSQPSYISGRFPVHHSPDSDTFDILDRQSFSAASALGKVVVENDLTDEPNELLIYIYNSPEDRQYVLDKFSQPLDSFSYTEELIQNIKEVKSKSFPTE